MTTSDEKFSFEIRRIIERTLSNFCRNRLAFKISDIGYKRDIDEYSVPLLVFNRYWISPSKIVKNTGRKWKPWTNRKYLLGSVMGGNWDIRDPPIPPSENYPSVFDERARYRSFKQYLDGEPWEETNYYQNAIKKANTTQDIKETKNHLESKLCYMNGLYKSIKQEGYLTQDQLGNYPNDKINRFVNEITVDIGRNGKFLHVDGHHRLEVAKAMNLNKVPVVVIVRHKQWMKKIESFYSTGELSGLPVEHPDVNFLKEIKYR